MADDFSILSLSNIYSGDVAANIQQFLQQLQKERAVLVAESNHAQPSFVAVTLTGMENFSNILLSNDPEQLGKLCVHMLHDFRATEGSQTLGEKMEPFMASQQNIDDLKHMLTMQGLDDLSLDSAMTGMDFDSDSMM